MCVVRWRAWVPIDSEFFPVVNHISWVTTVCRQTIVVVPSKTDVFRTVLGLTSLGSLPRTAVGIWALLLMARHVHVKVCGQGLGMSVIVMGHLGMDSELLVHGVIFRGIVTQEPSGKRWVGWWAVVVIGFRENCVAIPVDALVQIFVDGG